MVESQSLTQQLQKASLSGDDMLLLLHTQQAASKPQLTFEEVAFVVLWRWNKGSLITHDGFHGGLKSSSAIFVVNVEPR
jgi:hypothetical protein